MTPGTGTNAAQAEFPYGLKVMTGTRSDDALVLYEGVGGSGANRKTLRINSNNLAILNTAFSANLFILSDAGLLTITGGIRSIHATEGIGYATGAGGAVTQATSKATGVTLNKACGQITTATDALAAGAEVTFIVTNSAVAATDAIVANHASGGTVGAYSVSVSAVAAGSFRITITNLSGGSLSEALVINFAVIKGVAA
jgi:hypothetical protein